MALTGKAKKILSVVGVVVVLLVLALAIFVASLGGIIKTGIETVGSRVTKCKITVEDVDFSLLRGKLAITNLVVGNPDGFNTASAFELGQVKVSLVPSSVLSNTVIINEVVIDGPKVTYEAGLGSSNMGTIQKNIAAFLPAGGGKEVAKPAEGEKPAGEGKKIIIDHFLFDNAQINLSVKLLQGNSLPVPLPKIEANGIGRAKDAGDAEGEGIAAVEAVAIVLNRVVAGVITSATDAIAKLGGAGADAVKGVVGGGADAVKGAVGGAVEGVGSGLKGLLKRGADKTEAPAAQ